MDKANKQIGAWLLIGVFMIIVQVMIGGITRLTESGLSITKWNVVMGTLPPLSQQQWVQEFNSYKLSPQGRLINSEMDVEGFKHIFWWEYIHRLWARLFTPVFIIPLLVFLWQKKIQRKLLFQLLFAFVLGGLEGCLGWFMVSTGLNNVPWVSPYSLCAHLLLASTLFAYLLWLALSQFYPFSQGNAQLKTVSLSISVIVFIQLGLGAFMAGGIAPAAIWYPTWPKIGEAWIPETAFSKANPQWHTILENPAFVQLIHRSTAYLLIILIGYFWFKARKVSLPSAAKTGVNLLLLMIFIQATIGILTLINSQGKVPVLLGVLHQLGGLITFSFSVFTLFQLSKHNGKENANMT